MATYLPHIDRDLTTFPYHRWRVTPLHPFLKMREHLGRSYPTKRFGSFVSNHVVLGSILQNLQQTGNRVWREELTEDERDLVSVHNMRSVSGGRPR
jgi:hypothetical protein